MSLENQKKKEKNLENEDKVLSDNNYLVEESLIKFKEARSFSDFICMCVIAELNHNNYKNLSNNNNTIKENWNDFDFILSQIKDGKLEIKLENGKLKFNIDYDKEEVKSSFYDLNENLVYSRTYPYKQKKIEQEKNNIKNDSNQKESQNNKLEEKWNDFDFILSQIKDGKLEIKLENGKLKFNIDYDKEEVKSSFYDLNENLVYSKTYPYKQINMEQEKDTSKNDSKQVENQNNKEQKYEEFDDYGNLYKEGQFKNGLKEGIWKTYYDDSYDIENYHNGKLNGEFKKFSKDNHLLVKGEYKEHKKEGVWGFYYSDGGLKNEVEYKNGEIDGVCRTYYCNNGALKTETYCKNNVIDGTNKIYYEEGGLYKLENYKEGNLEGAYKEYFQGGGIRMEGNYKNGKKEGVWIDYESSEFLLFKNDILLERSSQEFKEKEEINIDSPIITEKNEVINNNNDENISNTKEFLTEKSGFLASLKNFFNKNTDNSWEKN